VRQLGAVPFAMFVLIGVTLCVAVVEAAYQGLGMGWTSDPRVRRGSSRGR
jgi:hypothetical protein